MMELENQYKTELEEVLDQYFPKGNDDRGKALMLFAEAMTRIRKTIKAFGGCTICYGKGYTTQITEAGEHMNVCSCDRGRQLTKPFIK